MVIAMRRISATSITALHKETRQYRFLLLILMVMVCHLRDYADRRAVCAKSRNLTAAAR